MSKTVDAQEAIVRAYFQKPGKGRKTKASAAIVALSDLGQKKRTRAAAREALLRIVQEDELDLAGSAMAYLAMHGLVGADDAALVPFLRSRAAVLHDDDYAYVKGLLLILGAAAFKEALELLRDPQRSISSRYSVTKALGEHTGLPFARDLLGRVLPDLEEPDFHLDELEQWEAEGYPLPDRVPVDELKSLGIVLPKAYLSYVPLQGAPRVTQGDSTWQMLGAAQLLSPAIVDDATFPAVQQLKGFAQSFEEATGQDSTVDAKGATYPTSRLAAGITIGTSDDGDLLYLDVEDKHAVYIFHHDGGDVEKLAPSFASWKKKLR